MTLPPILSPALPPTSPKTLDAAIPEMIPKTLSETPETTITQRFDAKEFYEENCDDFNPPARETWNTKPILVAGFPNSLNYNKVVLSNIFERLTTTDVMMYGSDNNCLNNNRETSACIVNKRDPAGLDLKDSIKSIVFLMRNPRLLFPVHVSLTMEDDDN